MTTSGWCPILALSHLNELSANVLTGLLPTEGRPGGPFELEPGVRGVWEDAIPKGGAVNKLGRVMLDLGERRRTRFEADCRV